MTENMFILWIMWETISIAIKGASVALVGVMFLFTVFALVYSLRSGEE